DAVPLIAEHCAARSYLVAPEADANFTLSAPLSLPSVGSTLGPNAMPSPGWRPVTVVRPSTAAVTLAPASICAPARPVSSVLPSAATLPSGLTKTTSTPATGPSPSAITAATLLGLVSGCVGSGEPPHAATNRSDAKSFLLGMRSRYESGSRCAQARSRKRRRG